MVSYFGMMYARQALLYAAKIGVNKTDALQ